MCRRLLFSDKKKFLGKNKKKKEYPNGKTPKPKN